MEDLIRVLESIDQHLAELADTFANRTQEQTPLPPKPREEADAPAESQFDIQKYIDRFR